MRCVLGKADGKRQTELIRYKQQRTPNEVDARKPPQIRKAARDHQNDGAERVNGSCTANRPTMYTDAADQADDGSPEKDGGQADGSGFGLVAHVGRGF